MEVDTTANPAKGNKMVQGKALQVQPGQENAGGTSNALQPQHDGIAMTSHSAVSPTNDKPFPFLRLPPEIRNMIYRCPSIYEGNSVQRLPPALRFCNLRQPPITRVNRQVRYEALPVFYNVQDFYVSLNYLPDDEDNGIVEYRAQISKMLIASIPAPDNAIQTSISGFLSNLHLEKDIGWDYSNIVQIGFTMSSSPFDVESDELHESQGVVDTTNLDWDNPEHIRLVCSEGIDSSVVCEDGVVVLECDNLRDCVVDEAVDQMASLMCLISKLCPQLTRTVLAMVELDPRLYDEVMDMRRSLREIDGSG